MPQSCSHLANLIPTLLSHRAPQQHHFLSLSKPHPTAHPLLGQGTSVSPFRLPTNSLIKQHQLLLHKMRLKKPETISPDSIFFRGSCHGCKICETGFNKVFFMRNANRHWNLCWLIWTDAIIRVGATSETLWVFFLTGNLISLALKPQINHSDRSLMVAKHIS